MRKLRHVVAFLICTGALIAPIAVANAQCGAQRGMQTVIEASVGAGPSAAAVTFRLLPGGIAEYQANGTCTLLAFTGMRDGSSIYTDDGLGRGLTVTVSKDRQVVVSHAAGWTARSQ